MDTLADIPTILTFCYDKVIKFLAHKSTFSLFSKCTQSLIYTVYYRTLNVYSYMYQYPRVLEYVFLVCGATIYVISSTVYIIRMMSKRKYLLVFTKFGSESLPLTYGFCILLFFIWYGLTYIIFPDQSLVTNVTEG